jgi:hypothetical protein
MQKIARGVERGTQRTKKVRIVRQQGIPTGRVKRPGSLTNDSFFYTCVTILKKIVTGYISSRQRFFTFEYSCRSHVPCVCADTNNRSVLLDRIPSATQSEIDGQLGPINAAPPDGRMDSDELIEEMGQVDKGQSDVNYPRDIAVEMNLRLNMDFHSVGQEGSIRRQIFIQDLKQDLVDASGMVASDFNILKVSPGSVVVDMNAPGNAAEEIHRQSLDPNSRLRSGKVTQFTDKISLTDLKIFCCDTGVPRALGTADQLVGTQRAFGDFEDWDSKDQQRSEEIRVKPEVSSIPVKPSFREEVFTERGCGDKGGNQHRIEEHYDLRFEENSGDKRGINIESKSNTLEALIVSQMLHAVKVIRQHWHYRGLISTGQRFCHGGVDSLNISHRHRHFRRVDKRSFMKTAVFRDPLSKLVPMTIIV